MIFFLHSRIKLYAVACAVTALTACGFRLQGDMGALPAATSTTYLDTADPYSDFYASLRDVLRDRGAEVVESLQDATAVLRIIEDESGQRILSVSARNVPREYEIFYLVTFSLEANGDELMPPQSILVTRSYTFDETQVLGKEREESELRRALAEDLARQVVPTT